MMGSISLIMIGVGIGGALGALLTTFVAYSKGFEQGFSDGEAEGLRGVLDGGRVHAEDLTHAAQ